MNIGKAFSYVFEDERWVTKVLLGGLITLVPILNIATFGYMLKTAHNVAYGNPHPLPEWGEDFGDTFMRGLYALVINFVYFIPYILLIVVFSCIVGIPLAGGETWEETGLLALCLVPIFLMVAFASALVSYAALARYVITDSLNEALKIGEVISAVRSNSKPWVMLFLVVLLASIVASLGLIACFMGVIFTAFYAYCVMGHALGQTVAQQSGSSTYVPDMPGYDPSSGYQ
ncbi:MAG: DUF4013 domain-containing protein [Chloroflexi bacterium AL-W]|nr:DUF4013 domain-containing protein [Chloroflexi bacterium AL-N1]NOK68538.1 DUF4013 domain-containing protein [Chloroflexi bacterium AL-N10]NOK76024.1 DUF4013 domain-containing protein [Chloroflexi bacterium AL-N5]NOK82495.1 DUF4013 domain-containing protein [Chloroflexi bacterium AL-W]NOK92807.1 DUF4013 domain-containing protein [Chloroflexi bacterium AL-N15]